MKSIRPPIPAPSWLTQLEQDAPDVLIAYSKTRIDTPRDYRSMDEVRKDPARPDRPTTVGWTVVDDELVDDTLLSGAIVESRDPTMSDNNYPIGQYWMNSVSGDMWIWS